MLYRKILNFLIGIVFCCFFLFAVLRHPEGKEEISAEQQEKKPRYSGAKPNIILIESDQHYGRAMSCAGHPVVRTPNMDYLAKNGVLFTNTYCPTPLCVPSRVSLLTGLYSHTTGVLTNSHSLPPEFYSQAFPVALQKAGYHTCVVGKIHFGGEPPTSPDCAKWLQGVGFDDAAPTLGKSSSGVSGEDDMYRRYLAGKGVLEKFSNDYKVTRKHHWYAAPSVLNEEDYMDVYIKRLALDWLKNYNKEKPFFLWINFPSPHPPWDAPGKYANMYDPANVNSLIVDPMEDAPEALKKKQKNMTAGMPPDAWRAVRANYYGMINVIDDSIGSILDLLKQRGLLENTVIVYTSDHGEMLYDHGLFSKTFMYEQSAVVPLIVMWHRGNFKQGMKVQTPVSTIDLVPFFLEIAEAQSLKAMHGKSLVPVLAGKVSAHREEVFSEMDKTKMLRQGDWKYVYNSEWKIQQLFNLHDDPQELKNLYDLPEHKERIAKMQNRILEWIKETGVNPNPLKGRGGKKEKKKKKEKEEDVNEE